MALEIPTCAACGLMAFPPHLRCARCGSDQWRSTAIERGILDAVTAVERSLVAQPDGPPIIGLVRLEGDVRVIARISGDAERGSEVLVDADGLAVTARPTPQ
jgi:uncharacterized OB-fold protein